MRLVPIKEAVVCCAVLHGRDRPYPKTMARIGRAVRLHEFITARHQEIIHRCRAKVLTQRPQSAVDHGVVPLFLDHLVNELRREPRSRSSSGSVPAHGHHDFSCADITLSQVAHDYVEVCLTITELALEESGSIDTNELRLLDRCLDQAIADIITEYLATQDPVSAEPILS